MSTAGSSLSHDALVDNIVTTVADAMRACYQPPPGLKVDDVITKSIADSAADKASAAVRDALSTHLPAPPAASDLPPSTETTSPSPSQRSRRCSPVSPTAYRSQLQPPAPSQLLLEEITKGHRPASEPATAFVASTAGARTAQNIPNNQGGGGGGGSSGNNSRNRRRGRGNGGGNSGQGSGHGGQTAGSQGGQGTGGQLAGQQASAPRQAQQWPTPFNPWAGTIHMWPGQASSILGRPPFAGAVFPGLQTSPAYSAGLGQFGQPGALPPHASLPPLQ
uniref:Uncharacterized protein n=1 Tax=Oryza nivara TaxID=4536 RepID=A0A0E0GP56_ORYNI